MARATKAGNGKEPLGFEQKLWAAADKMRGHMDPAEYKHVALVSLGVPAGPGTRIGAGAAVRVSTCSAPLEQLLGLLRA